MSKLFDSTQTADSIPFDNTTDDLQSENVREAIDETYFKAKNHSERHLPNGEDPLTTQSASTITTNGINTTGNGNAFSRNNHTHKVEIYYENVKAAGNVSTTSTSDVLLNGMSITPPSGTYLISFQTSITISGNDGQAYVSVYTGNFKQSESELKFRVGSGGVRDIEAPMTISEFPVTVNGSQSIQIRWRRSNGNSITSQVARSLTVKKVS